MSPVFDAASLCAGQGRVGMNKAGSPVAMKMRLFGVVVVALVVFAACDRASDTTDDVIGPTGEGMLSDWDEPVVVGEATSEWDPLNDVAVGPDGLPIVVFLGATSRTVEVRRCVDPDCTKIEGSSIEIPEDRFSFGQLHVEVGPSGLPLVVETGPSLVVDEEGGEHWGEPLVWLFACDDLACSQWKETHFDGEDNPAVAFTPDGRMVLATTVIEADPSNPWKGDTFLWIRTCGDALCEEELSKTEISVPGGFQAKSLLLDPDGVPTVVFGLPALGDPAGGAVVAYVCADETCSEAEPVLVAEIDSDSDDGWWFPYAAGEAGQAALAIGTPGLGVTVLIWDDPAHAQSVQIDPLDGFDDVELRDGVALGNDGLPVVVYLRASNSGQDSEVNSLIVAKCDDPACTSGTRSTLMREGTGLFLYYTPRMTLDLNGLPIITYGTCPQGCKTAHMNILRCTDPACIGQSKYEIETWSVSP